MKFNTEIFEAKKISLLNATLVNINVKIYK